MSDIKSILFYIEPWVELSKDFRLGAYGHYLALAGNLSSANPNLDIRFLMSDVLQEVIIAQNPHWIYDKTYIVPLKKLEEIYCNSQIAAYNNYNQQSAISNQQSAISNQQSAISNQQSAISNLISNIIIDNWQPDVIIMHETHAPFLAHLFPNALILHGMYGMTYKEPFPKTYLFDNLGLYRHATFNQSDIWTDIEISDSDRASLYKIKNWYAQQIIPHDPTYGIIEKYQSRFEKLILLPLQVDNYFAFTECSLYQNQLAYLEDVLQKTPKDWGVIVTGHFNYDKMVSDNHLMALKLKHINLIHLPELDNIPFVSQALLPHIDAVVSISSSLAFQALLFNKPVILAGDSHINQVATCHLAEIKSVFDKPYDELSNFKILKFFFTKYHLLENKKMENGVNFYHYLKQYYHNFLESKNKINHAFILPEIYSNLEDYYHDLQECSQWRQWNDLLTNHQIQKKPNPVFLDIVFHDIISWDLFDTLVDRPFIHPHESFQAIEDKIKSLTKNVYLPFHMIRRESERLARLNYQREVTLDEIYEFFEQKTHLPKKQIAMIKNLEIQAELLCVKARKPMQRTWEFAQAIGKVCSIITDIYLDKKTIESILQKNGYRYYDKLLVSSDLGIRKEDGTIYPDYLDMMREQHGVDKSFLHIGDNVRADGEMARKFGITAHIIPKAIDQFNQSYYQKIFAKALRHNSYDSSMVIGLIANRLFSSPKTYFDKETLFNDELYNVGYGILGAFILSYVQWVILKLKNYQADKVYFLARDGYLIMQVYHLLKDFYDDLPDDKYLLCSRRSVAVPSIFDVDDILETAMLNYGITTVANFMQSRFGLEMSQIPKNILKKYGFLADGKTTIVFPRDLQKTNAFVLDIQNIIFKKAKEERKLYGQYLKEQGLCDDKKIAMVDIGYSGTMQRKIMSLTNRSFIGLYMLTHNYVLPYFKHEIFEGWLGSYDNQRASMRHDFNDFIPLIESMLSSDAGSFNNFFVDKDGNRQINYLYSEQELSRCYFVNSIQQGALDFVKDYLKRLGSLSSDIHLPLAVGAHAMFEFAKNPNEKDVVLFEGLLLENMFAGSEFSIISNPKGYLNKDGKMNRESYHHLIQQSKWQQGASIAYKKYLDESIQTEHQPIIKTDSVPIKENHEIKQPLTKKQRLYRKVNNHPELFVQDLKVVPKPIKKAITKNETLLDFTKLIFKVILSK